jgi:hypothetical protein
MEDMERTSRNVQKMTFFMAGVMGLIYIYNIFLQAVEILSGTTMK